jgi:hypothetical protein
MDAEHYRRKARQNLIFAHEVKDRHARAGLIELAAHWKKMAEANKGAPQEEKNHPAQQARAACDGNRLAIAVTTVWPGA